VASIRAESAAWRLSCSIWWRAIELGGGALVARGPQGEVGGGVLVLQQGGLRLADAGIVRPSQAASTAKQAAAAQGASVGKREQGGGALGGLRTAAAEASTRRAQVLGRRRAGRRHG
jgi:hypothetical protein